MSEEEPEPTNDELRTALGKLAFNHTRRSSANTCYTASERIYELTEALRGLYFKTIAGTDDERHDALNATWMVLQKAGL